LSNKKQYDHLKSTIKDDVEIEFCTVSRLIRGKIVEETIVDNVEQRDDVVNPG
jgi:hypothetical protein